MANVYAVKSGNWSDVTVWNTGALPAAIDNVFSNNFTVTIDGTFVVASISNLASSPAVTGGGFLLNSGADLTASISLSSTPGGTNLGQVIGFSSSSPGIATFRGNLTNIASNQVTFIRNYGTGTLNIIGNISNDTFFVSTMVHNSSSGVINITGDAVIKIFNGGNTCRGVYNSSSGTVNITGTINCVFFNGTPSSAGTVLNEGNGTVNIIGNIPGIPSPVVAPVVNSSTGTINVIGTLGDSGYAIINSSSGTIIHTGPVYASATTPAIAPGSASQNTFLTGPFIGTAQGVVANQAIRWRWIASVGSSYMTAVTSGAGGTATGYKNLYTADSPLSNSGQPAASNVRSGIIYGPNNELTGTMVVPAANTVIAGVSVGNTIGTAQFASPADFWNVAIFGITTSGSIGERLKNSATVDSVASILSNALR
jgi:hypothetical protein